MLFLEFEFHEYCAFIVDTEMFLKLHHIFCDGDPESAENVVDEPQNFMFKVIVGETTFENKQTMVFDYMPNYKFINRADTVSSKIQVGDSSWAINIEEAESNYESFGCIELCYCSSKNNNGTKNFIKLMATPATFADVKETRFPISEINGNVAEYGYKLQVFNTKKDNFKTLMDERFTVVQRNEEINIAFNEIVVSGECDFYVRQEDWQSLVFYVEKAEITDLLYSEIVKHFRGNRYTDDESLFITKEWLHTFYDSHQIPLEEQLLRVDVGGEGLHYFPLNEGTDEVCQLGTSTGFANSINLNSQRNYSQITDLPIPRLVEMDAKWERKFPFGDDAVDVFTFQGTPIPTKYDQGLKKEFEQIRRCIASNGVISIWCSGEEMLCELHEFYDIYKSGEVLSGGCSTAVLEIQNPKNSFEKFYLGFKPVLEKKPTRLNPLRNFIIPIAVKIDNTDKYLGDVNSLRVDFIFLYDIYPLD